MRIDSHQHFWNYNSATHSWINETMSVLRRNFTPKDLYPILSSFGFDGCIAVEAHSSEQETEFLLRCAQENKFIKGVVGWVDLSAPNVAERLHHFSQNTLLKGVRHLVQDEPNGFMLDPAFQNGISKLHDYGLTYDILIYPHQLKEANELVAAFPNQKFVLDHIAKPYIKTNSINAWQKDIELLAQHQNLHCKISGMVTEANWHSWTNTDFTPYLDVVFACFGTDRIMFGSDWPVCLLAANYGEMLQIIENYIHPYPNAVQEQLMGKNAALFYNLNRS
ncbi:amidohydrolase family protein [Arenibacter sp. GZD96]|uniref:amidohydrolase family protein n=1 Tax=Aurantibrevibacter litoralis TaxID=3106030 RepID=UPI002AFE10A0|nr:amidohydrolase family protein [Arenibacter sp. GZD-96]MEA1786993.1 amidohydrolase family protein [Arenibacter sp. GZD-96]